MKLTPQEIVSAVEHLDEYDFQRFVELLNGALSESDKRDLREGLR